MSILTDTPKSVSVIPDIFASDRRWHTELVVSLIADTLSEAGEHNSASKVWEALKTLRQNTNTAIYSLPTELVETKDWLARKTEHEAK